MNQGDAGADEKYIRSCQHMISGTKVKISFKKMKSKTLLRQTLAFFFVDIIYGVQIFYSMVYKVMELCFIHNEGMAFYDGETIQTQVTKPGDTMEISRHLLLPDRGVGGGGASD